MNEKTVSTIIRYADPVVRDHTVHGVRIMPGVTFLDLFYRVAIASGFTAEKIELRKVHFIEPVAVSERFDRRLVIELRRQANGWRVAARTQRVRGDKAIDDSWQENAKAELHLIDARPELKKKLLKIIGTGLDLGLLYERMSSVGISHRDFMRCSGSAFVTQDGIWADVRPNEAALKYSSHFHLLPPLLDTATGMSAFSAHANARFENKPCVPLYIERFRALGPLITRCTIFLPLKPGTRLAESDFSRDESIEFYESTGNLIAIMEGIAYKKIRSIVSIVRLVRDSTETVAEPEIEVNQESERLGVPERIRTTVRRLVQARLKSQPSGLNDETGFYELGLESADLLQIVRELETICGRELYPTLLFEFATIARLVGWLEREVGEKGKWDDGPKVVPEKKLSREKTTSIPTEEPQFTPRSKCLAMDDGIAIIGMSGRYPKARNLKEFWKNLREGKDCIEEIPIERWDYRDWPGTYAKWGGFIEDYDKFDPLFFHLSPREAELMDPQERLFLEVVWHALEDAGLPPSRLRKQLASRDGRMGVFAGVMWGGYQLHAAEEMARGKAVVTSSGYWSLANRVSYLFDFQGPSLAVDTACSSSLTAIHLACQSLQRNECEMAIAGGVNLTLHPSKYLLLCQLKMASTDGKCRSFGEGGDGYVPGEGIGAVLLKPLSHAIEDGDRIYAVIRGSAVNHGGRSNGYSVPNPNAQSALIFEAMESAGIHPETLGYIEAHGTGTALGDPVEITGLTRAFEKKSKRKQFCAIGSLKSSIGHLEAAAGIAALTKVLLQMEHGKIVPSLHASKLNNNIDFPNTPFYVQRDLVDWQPATSHENTPPLPRRAGISSFGVGGANAHLIVEEYVALRSELEPSGGELIVLSARNAERLQESARLLREALHEMHKDGNNKVNLGDVAFTLQAGREAMEARLAIEAGTISDVEGALNAFLAGDTAKNLWTGSVKKENSENFKGLEDGEYIDQLISKQKLGRLASLWVNGVELDFERLHPNRRRIVSLPGYPFARERFWLPGIEVKQAKRLEAEPSDRDNGVLLRKSFKNADQIWSDHEVRGEAILPGAAVLELVHEAARLRQQLNQTVMIKHVVWTRPLRSNNGQLDLELRETDGGIGWELHDLHGDENSKRAQGKLVFNRSSSPGKTSVQAIRSRLGKVLLEPDVYRRFAAAGLNYGPTYQVIVELQGNEREALARLHSEKESGTQSTIISADLIDGAFQAVSGIGDFNSQNALFLPFSLDELEVYAPVSRDCYAHVELLEEKLESRKFNIQILDPSGNVLVRLTRFVLRRFDEPERESVFYLKPIWNSETSLEVIEEDGPLLILGDCQEILDKLPIGAFKNKKIVTARFGKGFVRHGDNEFEIRPGELPDLELLWAELKKAGLPLRIVNWMGNGIHLLKAEEVMFGAALAVFQTHYKHGGGEPLRYVQAVGKCHLTPALQQMMSAFGRTLQIEHPKYHCKAIHFKKSSSPEELIRVAIEESNEAPEKWHHGVTYDEGGRMVWGLTPSSPDESQEVILRAGGVYVITGGAGGLGRIIAEGLARRCPVKLLLIGRRPLGGHAWLEPLRAHGVEAKYVQADLTDLKQLADVLRNIREHWGAIRGVIHSAGVIEDTLIQKKTRDSWQRVFGSKVAGAVNVDELTADDPLDFFVLFSSLSAVTGNMGQADYASANGFLDGFAEAREQRRKEGLRQGRSLSINWPWWKDGGMNLPAAARENLERKYGLVALGKAEGLEAFFRSLRSDSTQVLVACGKREKLWSWLKVGDGRSKPSQSEKAKSSTPGKVDQIENALVQITSGVLKVKPADLDTETDLGEYGVDSVTLMEIVTQIEKRFEITLEPSALTEYPTLGKLARFLGNEVRQVAPILEARNGKTHSHNIQILDPANNKHAEITRTAQGEPIAVIGMAGRLGQSPNLETFWKHLIQAKHLVEEVPESRWDITAFFSPDAKALNKSYSKWGSFMDSIDAFDPGYFGIKEEEAAGIDPQQRITLELAQELFDRAGYARSELNGRRLGVFLGAGQSDYLPNRLQLWAPGAQNHVIVNQLSNMVAARLSDFFHLRGPSLTMDTACSASLVAIHQACQSLRAGECESAIAGGIQLLIDPSYSVGFSQAGVLSKKGVCAVFDRGADGMVLGEGAGLVLLKPLSRAMRDGDMILGIVLGSAVNNDGHTMGLTTPSLQAQQDVISAALENAQVDPATISYLEAHGTGTPLGDPIEIKAATQVFRKFTADRQFCGVGSVKSNIGHLLRAAGVASFLKVMLAMREGVIPATLHCEQPHPRFRFGESPFKPITATQEWNRRDGTRRAGISSFGFGGTNCHMIVEEFCSEGYKPSRGPLPLTVFHRNRYWLGQSMNANGNGNEHSTDSLMEMIRKVRSREISVREAQDRIGIKNGSI